jgi:hypothetical protein
LQNATTYRILFRADDATPAPFFRARREDEEEASEWIISHPPRATDTIFHQIKPTHNKKKNPHAIGNQRRNEQKKKCEQF